MRMTSPSQIRSCRVITCSGGLVLALINSIGTLSATHFAPWSAEAAAPAITPLRPDHNQAAVLRCRSDTAVRLST